MERYLEEVVGMDEYGVVRNDEVLQSLLWRASHRALLFAMWLFIPCGFIAFLVNTQPWTTIGITLFCVAMFLGVVQGVISSWMGIPRAVTELIRRKNISRGSLIRSALGSGFRMSLFYGILTYALESAPTFGGILTQSLLFGIFMAGFDYVRRRKTVGADKRHRDSDEEDIP